MVGTFRGYRIFTACRTVKVDKVFMLNDHINRLVRSARQIKMQLPHTSQQLKNIIQGVIAQNKKFKKDLLLEIMYSGGQANSSGVGPKGKAKIYILVFPFKAPSLWWYQKGIALASFPYQRQFPEVKLLNYVGAVIAHQTVVKKFKTEEALFVSPRDNQTILEGTTFNFFIVKEKTIYTSPLDGRILPGITRKVVLKLASKLPQIKLKEKRITLKDLKTATEAFLTSSTRNVVPVVRVNRIKIGDGKPREVNKILKNEFERYLEGY